MGNEVIQETGEATGFLLAPDNRGKPITVIGTKDHSQRLRRDLHPASPELAWRARSSPTSAVAWRLRAHRARYAKVWEFRPSGPHAARTPFTSGTKDHPRNSASASIF